MGSATHCSSGVISFASHSVVAATSSGSRFCAALLDELSAAAAFLAAHGSGVLGRMSPDTAWHAAEGVPTFVCTALYSL